MIIFNNLRITSNNETLTINASIKDSIYYKDVYIDSIIIDNQDTYVGSSPSSRPVFSKTINDSIKNINLHLDKLDIQGGLVNNIFFVYILTKGTPTADTPCGEDSMITKGVVYNLYPFFTNIMKYMKLVGLSCGDTCDIPLDFINAFLQMKGIEFSARTGNYIETISLWKLMMNNFTNIQRTNRRCNGR